MADELKDPSEDKQRQGIKPEAMKVIENTNNENHHRQQDRWNAQSMASTVHWMLVAGGILRDPLLAGAVPWHDYAGIIHRTSFSCIFLTPPRTKASAVPFTTTGRNSKLTHRPINPKMTRPALSSVGCQTRFVHDRPDCLSLPHSRTPRRRRDGSRLQSGRHAAWPLRCPEISSR